MCDKVKIRDAIRDDSAIRILRRKKFIAMSECVITSLCVAQQTIDLINSNSEITADAIELLRESLVSIGTSVINYRATEERYEY